MLTFCGLGLAPVAPGTFGTLGGVLLAIPIVLIPGVPGWLGLLAAAALAVALGVALGGFAERHFDCKDPGQVVIDEVAGQWLTLLLVPADITLYAIGFALFRLADIVKPWPIDWVDKRVKGGFGVMFDDILAGALAAIILWNIWILTKV